MWFGRVKYMPIKLMIWMQYCSYWYIIGGNLSSKINLKSDESSVRSMVNLCAFTVKYKQGIYILLNRNLSAISHSIVISGHRLTVLKRWWKFFDTVLYFTKHKQIQIRNKMAKSVKNVHIYHYSSLRRSFNRCVV